MYQSNSVHRLLFPTPPQHRFPTIYKRSSRGATANTCWVTRSVGQLPTSVTVASAGPFTRPVRNRLEIIKCPSFTKRHTQESCARVFRRLNWSKNHTSIRQRDGKLIRWCFNVRQRAHSALLFVYWFVSRKRGIPARDAMNDGNLAFTSELLWLYPIRRAISFSDKACCS